MPTHPYDNWKAIEYAKSWCDKEDNSCGIYLQGDKRSDCAHFIAHCLHAGGITIINTDPGTNFCPLGLAVRNTVLVPALRNLAKNHSNIKELGLSDTIVGDIGFLDSPIRPYHAFMICEPVDLRKIPAPPAKVYAHSSSRCCEQMNAQWQQWLSTIFRIENA